MKTTEIKIRLNQRPARSAWDKGVKTYAAMILENIGERDLPTDPAANKETLLAGAASWLSYSYAACARITNEGIARPCARHPN